MPSKHQWEDGQAVERLRAVFDAPILLHVKTRILVHARVPKRKKSDPQHPPCPCCGSRQARIVEELPDLELLIDRVTGERKLKTEIEDMVGWDALCKVARAVDIPLRCHRGQLKLLLATKPKVIQALAGNRAGKTTSGCGWLVRQWMLKGGRGAEFWWVSPQRSQTQIGVQKLAVGEFSDRQQPPAFPLDEQGRPILVLKWPETERSSDQRVVMIDGSSFVLHHASRPTGGNLKGKNVRAILIDETCEVAHRANWTVLLARLIDSGGSIYSSTTPRPGHWLKEEVIDAAKNNRDILVVSLSSRDNPWIPQEEILRTIRVAHDDGEVAREIDGMWVSSKGSLWMHFDPKRHIRHDPSFNLPKEFGADVTAQATASWWRGDNPYVSGLRLLSPQFVVGMDVNCSPMTAVICKIFGEPNRPEKWGIYVVDEVPLFHTDTWQFGNHLRGAAGDKVRRGAVSYANLPIAMDPTACTWDPTATRGGYAKHSSSAARTMSQLGFDCRSANLSDKGHPAGVGRHFTTGLLQTLMREDRLFIQATRCPNLHRALSEQENDGKGLAVKVSNTSSDKLSSPVDALAYVAWAIFQDQYQDRQAAKIQVL